VWSLVDISAPPCQVCSGILPLQFGAASPALPLAFPGASQVNGQQRGGQLCRKSTGSAYAANILLPIGQFSWLSGQALLGRYELPGADSYNNFFCTTCGSHLPWESRDGRWVLVPAGTLDADPGATPDKNIFWGYRAPWYTSVDTLPKFGETG
jgi:hypothetical protein